MGRLLEGMLFIIQYRQLAWSKEPPKSKGGLKAVYQQRKQDACCHPQQQMHAKDFHAKKLAQDDSYSAPRQHVSQVDRHRRGTERYQSALGQATNGERTAHYEHYRSYLCDKADTVDPDRRDELLRVQDCLQHHE